MPQPKQVNISLIVSDLIISASSRQVEFLILPRSGSTAWFGALHSLPPPAAESIGFLYPTDYFFSYINYNRQAFRATCQ